MKTRILLLNLLLLLMFAGGTVVYAAVNMPQTMQATPNAAGGKRTFKWVKKTNMGKCVDPSMRCVNGEVWYKVFSDGKKSCDFIDKISLCRTCSAFLGSCNDSSAGRGVKESDLRKRDYLQ